MDEEQKQLRHEVTKCLRQRSVWENRYFLAKSKYEALYGPEKTIKKKPVKPAKPVKPKKTKAAPKKKTTKKKA